MSGRATAAEKHVLELFKTHNRPFSVQVVADFLAQHGIKKAQVQKTLDALAEASKITVKVKRDNSHEEYILLSLAGIWKDKDLLANSITGECIVQGCNYSEALSKLSLMDHSVGSGEEEKGTG